MLLAAPVRVRLEPKALAAILKGYRGILDMFEMWPQAYHILRHSSHPEDPNDCEYRPCDLECPDVLLTNTDGALILGDRDNPLILGLTYIEPDRLIAMFHVMIDSEGGFVGLFDGPDDAKYGDYGFVVVQYDRGPGPSFKAQAILPTDEDACDLAGFWTSDLYKSKILRRGIVQSV